MNTGRAKTHHKPNATDRFFFVVASLTITWHSIFCQRIGVTGTADAIPDRFGSNLNRCKKMFKLRHWLYVVLLSAEPDTVPGNSMAAIAQRAEVRDSTRILAEV